MVRMKIRVKASPAMETPPMAWDNFSCQGGTWRGPKMRLKVVRWSQLHTVVSRVDLKRKCRYYY